MELSEPWQQAIGAGVGREPMGVAERVSLEVAAVSLDCLKYSVRIYLSILSLLNLYWTKEATAAVKTFGIGKRLAAQ